jgi:hypothetical protein
VPLLLLYFAGLLAAQPDYYRFTVNQDALSGAVDFSYLNHPITAADRIFVRDGKFHRVGADLTPNTDDDERVRFFGANLAFGANFPEEQDAVRIARRLRAMGINMIRLHHMDSQPDSNPNNANSILTTGPYPTLNPVAVRRLRVFLDALRAEGVYVNLNLKVGYVFRTGADGVPAPAGGAIGDQSKPLHMILPRMVELQAEYTRRVIEALALSGDPVLGVVEINNESSLVYSWQANQIEPRVAGEYKSHLQREWNAYLARSYKDSDTLRRVWSVDETDGPELLQVSGGWRPELHGAARATLEQSDDGGAPALRVQVDNGSDWVIIKQTGFSLNTARPYTAVVEMRADLPDGETRNVYWDIKQDVSPWRGIQSQNVQVGNQWRRYTMSFTPAFAVERAGRFAVQVEAFQGTRVYLRAWSLSQPARRGLGDGESLEAQNIPLVEAASNATAARLDDYLRFLAELDRQYLNTILAAVRESAGPLVPVAGTQMNFGSPLNLDSHRDLDYQDVHYYVDHYGFPNVAWDGRDWYITERSNLGAGLTPFLSAATTREAGRPYTVSEFNQPWPNSYAAEADPTLAAFAAFQDWDGLMHFAYAHSRNWDAGVPNGFNLNGDWTKFINLGQSAWLFRTGAVVAGEDPLTIGLSEAQRLAATRQRLRGNLGGLLKAEHGVDAALPFTRRVAIARSEGETPVVAAPSAPYVSSGGETTYDPDGRLFLIHSARAAGVFGFPAAKVAAGPLEVELPGAGAGFVSLFLTPLDGRVLEESSRLLLTNPGPVLRSQPGEPVRPQRLVNYPGQNARFTLEREPGFANKPSGNLNGGEGPTWMKRVECFVTLRGAMTGLTVYPLDGAGRRLAPLPDSAVRKVDGGFRIDLQAEGQELSPWYELAARR